MNAFEMVTRCAQRQTPGGIYVDLTETERIGLLSVNEIVSAARQVFVHPEQGVGINPEMIPLPHDLAGEQRELGLGAYWIPRVGSETFNGP